MQLHSVQIGTAALGEAVTAYTLLLGVEPVHRADGAWRFQLERGAVELVHGAPGVQSIRFSTEEAETPTPDAFHGLTVLLERPPIAEAGRTKLFPDAVEAIDHVVVRTPDPDRAIRLWRDRLGLRLALDRTFPERGLRLLFFRSGGITLEFASGYPALEERDGSDAFYGVSYRVSELEARRARLLQLGLDVSPIRPGMRPSTSVVTVRSGTATVPTLLLQVHAGARG